MRSSQLRRQAPTQSTYLVDHHPQLFDLEPQPRSKHVASNFATMPRHLPALHAASRTSTFSRSGQQPPQPSSRPQHYDAEEMQRQAYIQSLGEYDMAIFY